MSRKRAQREQAGANEAAPAKDRTANAESPAEADLEADLWVESMPADEPRLMAEAMQSAGISSARLIAAAYRLWGNTFVDQMMCECC